MRLNWSQSFVQYEKEVTFVIYIQMVCISLTPDAFDLNITFYSLQHFSADNTTILWDIFFCPSLINGNDQGRNINYFPCYDIQRAFTHAHHTRSCIEINWVRSAHAFWCHRALLPLFPWNKNMHKMALALSIVLITLTITKGKDLNWLLASCKDCNKKILWCWAIFFALCMCTVQAQLNGVQCEKDAQWMPHTKKKVCLFYFNNVSLLLPSFLVRLFSFFFRVGVTCFVVQTP